MRFISKIMHPNLTINVSHSLELRLLDEAAVVFIQDLKDIFDFLGRLRGQAAQLEELFVAE